MKKTIVMAIAFASFCCTFAQENQEVKYRRSSLYTMMIPDKDLSEEAKSIVVKTFSEMPIPDKYNDHNLDIRDASDVYNIEVSPEDIKAIENETGAKKSSKFKSLAKGAAAEAGNALTGDESPVKIISDNEYVARLMNYFKKNKVAHKLIEKWYGYDSEKKMFDHKLQFLKERGHYSASEEEKNLASQTKTGMNKLEEAASMDLVPRTFVMVTRYSYLSAEELINMIAGPATVAAAQGGGVAAVAAAKTMETLHAKIKGYFVKTSSYLFQLSWNADLQKKFKSTVSQGGYWMDMDFVNGTFAPKNSCDIIGFENDENYKLNYIGKTWCYAPASFQIAKGHGANVQQAADEAMIKRATVRATDKSIMQLQKKYEVFRTMSPVQVSEDGKTCFAYIGLKEGIQAGDKFDVMMPSMDKEGNIEYKKVTSVKVLKDKVWDNRYASKVKIEGEEDVPGADLEYTTLSGSKKIMSGMLLKQKK